MTDHDWTTVTTTQTQTRITWKQVLALALVAAVVWMYL